MRASTSSLSLLRSNLRQRRVQFERNSLVEWQACEVCLPSNSTLHAWRETLQEVAIMATTTTCALSLLGRRRPGGGSCLPPGCSWLFQPGPGIQGPGRALLPFSDCHNPSIRQTVSWMRSSDNPIKRPDNPTARKPAGQFRCPDKRSGADVPIVRSDNSTTPHPSHLFWFEQ